MDTRALLIEQAERSHAAYPQYRGHWDTWVLVRIRQTIKSRGTVIATKGEVVLMDPASVGPNEHREDDKVFCTVFLPNHYIEQGCDTSVSYDKVKEI